MDAPTKHGLYEYGIKLERDNAAMLKALESIRRFIQNRHDREGHGTLNNCLCNEAQIWRMADAPPRSAQAKGE